MKIKYSLLNIMENILFKVSDSSGSRPIIPYCNTLPGFDPKYICDCGPEHGPPPNCLCAACGLDKNGKPCNNCQIGTDKACTICKYNPPGPVPPGPVPPGPVPPGPAPVPPVPPPNTPAPTPSIPAPPPPPITSQKYIPINKSNDNKPITPFNIKLDIFNSSNLGDNLNNFKIDYNQYSAYPLFSYGPSGNEIATTWSQGPGSAAQINLQYWGSYLDRGTCTITNNTVNPEAAIDDYFSAKNITTCIVPYNYICHINIIVKSGTAFKFTINSLLKGNAIFKGYTQFIHYIQDMYNPLRHKDNSSEYIKFSDDASDKNSLIVLSGSDSDGASKASQYLFGKLDSEPIHMTIVPCDVNGNKCSWGSILISIQNDKSESVERGSIWATDVTNNQPAVDALQKLKTLKFNITSSDPNNKALYDNVHGYDERSYGLTFTDWGLASSKQITLDGPGKEAAGVNELINWKPEFTYNNNTLSIKGILWNLLNSLNNQNTGYNAVEIILGNENEFIDLGIGLNCNKVDVDITNSANIDITILNKIFSPNLGSDDTKLKELLTTKVTWKMGDGVHNYTQAEDYGTTILDKDMANNIPIAIHGHGRINGYYLLRFLQEFADKYAPKTNNGDLQNSVDYDGLFNYVNNLAGKGDGTLAELIMMILYSAFSPLIEISCINMPDKTNWENYYNSRIYPLQVYDITLGYGLQRKKSTCQINGYTRMRDSDIYQNKSYDFNRSAAKVYNLKMVGMFGWASDGVEIVNSRNSMILSSFMNICDDNIKVGSESMTIYNNTLHQGNVGAAVKLNNYGINCGSDSTINGVWIHRITKVSDFQSDRTGGGARSGVISLLGIMSWDRCWWGDENNQLCKANDDDNTNTVPAPAYNITIQNVYIPYLGSTNGISLNTNGVFGPNTVNRIFAIGSAGGYSINSNNKPASLIFPKQKDNFPTTIYDPAPKGEPQIYYAGAINNLKILGKSSERKNLLSGFGYSAYESEIDSYVNPIFKSSFWQWSSNPPDQGIFKSPAVIFSDTVTNCENHYSKDDCSTYNSAPTAFKISNVENFFYTINGIEPDPQNCNTPSQQAMGAMATIDNNTIKYFTPSNTASNVEYYNPNNGGNFGECSGCFAYSYWTCSLKK